MIHAQTKTSENKPHKILWNKNISLNSGQKTRSSCSNQEEMNVSAGRLYCSANHNVKIKESEKLKKYLDIAWEQKKLTVTPSNWSTWNNS